MFDTLQENPSATDSYILQLESVSRRYGGIQASDNMSFGIRQGTITGVIGPNGAGKTTLFNLISGYEKPDSGRIVFRGSDIGRLPPHKVSRLGIGRTFQSVKIFGGLSVLDNLRLADMYGRGRRRAPFEARAEELLTLVSMVDFAQRESSALSYGQQKLVEIAMALMAEPDLLLLDEPVSGVNPVLIRQFGDLLLRLRERGLTILMVEHNVPFVADICDWVIAIAQGSLLAEGNGSDIQDNAVVLEAFLGG